MGTRSKRELAGDVWLLMARFAMDKFQRGAHLELLRQEGLTPGHMKTLSVLDADEPRPMGVIADQMRCDASQMTWLVDRLEERGLVERRRDAADGRRVLAAITEAGRAIAAEATEPLNKVQFGLGMIDEATAAQINAVLRRVREGAGDIAEDVADPWTSK